MDMFLWLAAVFAVWPLVRRLFSPRSLPTPTGYPGQGSDGLNVTTRPPIRATTGREWVLARRSALAVILVLAVACVPVVKHQRRSARWIARPVKIETTIEYKTAKWLDAHMRSEEHTSELQSL